MIEVELVRTGMNSKRYFTLNRKGLGVFKKKFECVEDLVYYLQSQHFSVAFAPGYKLPPDIKRVLFSKNVAMHNKITKKKYPAINRTINKTMAKRKKRFGM